VAELETQILVSIDLGMTTAGDCADLLKELEEISRMIIGLQRNLKKKMTGDK
jgi:four helix bundle protein